MGTFLAAVLLICVMNTKSLDITPIQQDTIYLQQINDPQNQQQLAKDNKGQLGEIQEALTLVSQDNISQFSKEQNLVISDSLYNKFSALKGLLKQYILNTSDFSDIIQQNLQIALGTKGSNLLGIISNISDFSNLNKNYKGEIREKQGDSLLNMLTLVLTQLSNLLDLQVQLLNQYQQTQNYSKDSTVKSKFMQQNKDSQEGQIILKQMECFKICGQLSQKYSRRSENLLQECKLLFCILQGNKDFEAQQNYKLINQLTPRQESKYLVILQFLIFFGLCGLIVNYYSKKKDNSKDYTRQNLGIRPYIRT